MNQDHIDVLYPSTPTDTDQENQSTSLDGSAGEFSDSPEPTLGNPYAVNPESTEDTLYGGSNTVKLSDTTDLNIIYNDPAEQENLKSSLGYMAGEVGLDQAGIETFVNITNEYLLTGEKSDPQSTMQQLYLEHGQALHDKLSSAQALIKSLPDLASYLDETGLGSHQKFINEVLKAAESPRALERLKQLTLLGKN